MENLPGFPDNIRLSYDGSKIYVALAGVRFKDKFLALDFLGKYPWIRKAIVAVSYFKCNTFLTLVCFIY